MLQKSYQGLSLATEHGGIRLGKRKKKRKNQCIYSEINGRERLQGSAGVCLLLLALVLLGIIRTGILDDVLWIKELLNHL